MLGQRIKTLRQQRALTQRELAKRVNTTVTQVSRWENGHHPPNAENIRKLARVLRVPISSITEAEDGS